MSSDPAHRRESFPTTVVCIVLGGFWLATALEKVLPLALRGDGGSADPTWADQFPVPLVVAAVGLELCAGLLMLFGRRVYGLILAVVLLAVFSVLMLTFPLKPGQSCGCGGPAEVVPMRPVARNAALAGVHGLVLAFAAPLARRSGSH